MVGLSKNCSQIGINRTPPTSIVITSFIATRANIRLRSAVVKFAGHRQRPDATFGLKKPVAKSSTGIQANAVLLSFAETNAQGGNMIF